MRPADISPEEKSEGLSVRLSNAFGAPAGKDVPRWSLVFNDLCRQAVLQKKLVLKSSGIQRRNFITLTDTVRALEFLAAHRADWPEDGVIHLGAENQWSILEVANKVAACARDIVGLLPPVVVPPQAAPENGEAIEFHIDRLKKLGFTWINPWEQEIKDTLKLCVRA